MGLVLDTSVLVAAERGGLDRDWLARGADADTEVVIAAITAHELLRGVARLPAGLSRVRAERWLERLVDTLTVVPYDYDVARVHAALWADLAGRGLALGASDQIIAATALSLDFDLVTHDRAFEQVPGLTVQRW